jgi:hypothetical protein
MGFLHKLFGSPEPIDVLRGEIFMDFRPRSGRGAAVVRWVPVASDDGRLRPFLVTLLYARILTVHKETRSDRFTLIGELSKRNIRDEGAAGFVFPEWSLNVPGVPSRRIWPWDLSQDITASSASKIYVATLQAFQPKEGRGYFDIHLKMAFGLERVLAPASARRQRFVRYDSDFHTGGGKRGNARRCSAYRSC